MFKTIRHIDDVRPFVGDKKEIRFQTQPNGVTMGCYMFVDTHTFDVPEARECRGIAFDKEGLLVSRPLHKFFNLGEKEHLSLEHLSQRTDVVAIYEKLDGSMLATAWLDGELHWRSQKSFTSDVVHLTKELLSLPAFLPTLDFAREVASQGYTAIFELTHPQARIVVAPPRPELRLLHVRHNETGEYVLLNPFHPIQDLIRQYGVPRVATYPVTTWEPLIASLANMTEQEGYVVQFADGEMVKLKCPWYQSLHRSITFLRERDIAMSSLAGELDDLKALLAKADVDLAPVNEVETRLKSRMLELMTDIETVVERDKHLDRKSFALSNQKHPLFGLMVAVHQGKEINLAQWFIKHRLKDEFSLRVLADSARVEALEG